MFNGIIKQAEQKNHGGSELTNTCNSSQCVFNDINTLIGRDEITLNRSAKKESNIMNSLVFELTNQELNDQSAKFYIDSYLWEKKSIITDRDLVLYDRFIEVDIQEILNDLILANNNEELVGYSVPFYDPEIMKAQYGLFKTFDSGPNGKLWVRQVGNTLEGPISLGNTTSNYGARAAAWIKFELLEY